VENPSKSDLNKALRFLEASGSIFHDVISNFYHHFHPDKGIDLSTMIYFWRLVHRCYTYGANYKNRHASTAAYWAETLLFGGTVLFRRGEDERQVCIKIHDSIQASNGGSTVKQHISILAKEISSNLPTPRYSSTRLLRMMGRKMRLLVSALYFRSLSSLMRGGLQ
jgi:hypothetical protein